jgi:O-antigen/teichoic acid export membrane protein
MVNTSEQKKANVIPKSESIRARAADGGRWTASSAVASVVIQIIQIAILGRLLRPADFGVMAMMMVVIGLITAFADLGLGNYMVQAEMVSRQMYVKILTNVGGFAVILSSLGALSATYVAAYYRQPQIAEMLPWLTISAIGFAIGQIMVAALQRFLAFRQIAIGEISSAMASLLTSSFLALSNHGVWSLVFGQVVGSVTRLAVLGWQLPSMIKKLADDGDVDDSKMRSFALYQSGERLLNFLSVNMDKLIVGRFLGEIGLGIYSIAFQLMMRPMSVVNPIFTRVALPLFVNLRDNDERLTNGYLETIRMIAFLTFPVYILVAVCSPLILTVLAGPQWLEAAPILYVLSIVGIFFSIGNPIGSLILAKSKPQFAFLYNTLALAVYSCAFLIGSRFSPIGVALAFLLATALVMFPSEFYLRKILIGMTVRQYWISLKHLFIASTIPLILHAALLSRELKTLSAETQIITGVSAIIFFLIYLQKFDPNVLKSSFNLLLRGR